MCEKKEVPVQKKIERDLLTFCDWLELAWEASC